ncbi:urease subunit gamma [Pseudomonas aeruginosa]
MDLSPREKDKLLIFTAGLLARAPAARGLKLELPGGGGADLRRPLLEGAHRDGRSVAELMHYGTTPAEPRAGDGGRVRR